VYLHICIYAYMHVCISSTPHTHILTRTPHTHIPTRTPHTHILTRTPPFLPHTQTHHSRLLKTNVFCLEFGSVRTSNQFKSRVSLLERQRPHTHAGIFFFDKCGPFKGPSLEGPLKGPLWTFQRSFFGRTLKRTPLKGPLKGPLWSKRPPAPCMHIRAPFHIYTRLNICSIYVYTCSISYIYINEYMLHLCIYMLHFIYVHKWIYTSFSRRSFRPLFARRHASAHVHIRSQTTHVHTSDSSISCIYSNEYIYDFSNHGSLCLKTRISTRAHTFADNYRVPDTHRMP